MKRILAGFAVLVFGVAALQADTVVTNRGQVITVRTATDTATSVRDLDVFQDMSTYATKPGQVGKIVRWYDFAKLGGAVGTIKLVPEVAIPNNAVIRDGYVKTVTAVAPVSTTNSLGLNTTIDIVAANTNFTKLNEFSAIVPVGTAATAVQLTADRYLTTTISDAAATAGKFMVVLDYELAP